MYYISHLVKGKKKFKSVILIAAESKMAAYIVFQSGHTFGASVSSPCIFRSVELPKAFDPRSNVGPIIVPILLVPTHWSNVDVKFAGIN